MKGLKYTDPGDLLLVEYLQTPEPKQDEALIRVIRAGICSTDLELIKGYVPGFDGVLGHEFVGVVERCTSKPDLQGQRVVGEINCIWDDFQHPDPVFLRNHAPNRQVLGIINKDGAMAEYITLPASNLHLVPDTSTDAEACFAEPLAAAARIIEQQVLTHHNEVAVVGDGKLGLLVAQLLTTQKKRVVHFGRHPRKLNLVHGTEPIVVDDSTAMKYSESFTACVEASGTSQGILLASAITKPMSTIIAKSTCSLNDPNMPSWSQLANDIVVNEKTIVGSRCGPFPAALRALQDPNIKSLVNAMIDGVYTLADAVEAIQKAGSKGTLKIQLQM